MSFCCQCWICDSPLRIPNKKAYYLLNEKRENMKTWHILGVFTFVIIGIVLISGCTSTGSTSAQPAQVTTQPTIPNLTGTWNTTSEGSVMFKSNTVPGQWTHHKDVYSILTGQMLFTKQQGRVVYGTFTASRGPDENFIGVINMDNKSAYFADQDGFFDCQIVNNDQINMIYRQVTANDTIVAVGTWTRVK